MKSIIFGAIILLFARITTLIVHQGILTLLSFHSDIKMVGEAGDGQEAVEKARQLHPDVILMDINMPRMDGIQATRVIHSELPNVRIIGLSMHDKEDQADQMIQAGGSAYCTKDGNTDELLSAIRRSD
ncbi:MAG: response regulator transcription factor [Desulfotignum sp.]